MSRRNADAAPPRTLSPRLKQRIPKRKLNKSRKKDHDIWGMCYNSARNELFLADINNKVVRAMRLREKPRALRDVYKVKIGAVYSVCHMSDSDTLLVCSHEYYENQWGNWLVALRRIADGNEWRETHRLPTDESGYISCALTDSRVLIGDSYSTYLELFRVQSGARVARICSFDITEEYKWFSATNGSGDTLVAMSYNKDALQEVRVHRMRGDRLEEIARTPLQLPKQLLWLANRLLATEYDGDTKSDSVAEFELSGTRLERRSQLVAYSDGISVERWCAVNNGLAIVDYNTKDILHYKL